jgi:hypothetical protein
MAFGSSVCMEEGTISVGSILQNGGTRQEGEAATDEGVLGQYHGTRLELVRYLTLSFRPQFRGFTDCRGVR